MGGGGVQGGGAGREHAGYAAASEKDLPVLGGLVPARLRGELERRRHLRGRKNFGDQRALNRGHRAPRIWSACPGSAGRAPPSPQPNPASSREARPAGRTSEPPRS